MAMIFHQIEQKGLQKEVWKWYGLSPDWTEKGNLQI